MPITPAADIAAVYCGSKRAYPTLEEAERWAARHYACRTCVDGSARFTAYLCSTDPSHAHCGHLGVGWAP